MWTPRPLAFEKISRRARLCCFPFSSVSSVRDGSVNVLKLLQTRRISNESVPIIMCSSSVLTLCLSEPLTWMTHVLSQQKAFVRGSPTGCNHSSPCWIGCSDAASESQRHTTSTREGYQVLVQQPWYGSTQSAHVSGKTWVAASAFGSFGCSAGPPGAQTKFWAHAPCGSRGRDHCSFVIGYVSETNASSPTVGCATEQGAWHPPAPKWVPS